MLRWIPLLVLALAAFPARACPPGTGILSRSRSCLACHTSLGPWSDEARTIIDVVDAKTKASCGMRASSG